MGKGQRAMVYGVLSGIHVRDLRCLGTLVLFPVPPSFRKLTPVVLSRDGRGRDAMLNQRLKVLGP